MDIHAIVACVLQRSACYAHMHLSRTCLTKHLDNLQRCGSAYNRIVHQHNPLALDDGLHRRKLHLDALLTHRLRRKDESTSHILALDESHLIRKTAGLRITLSGTETRIRHSDDYVSIGRSLLEENPAGFLSVIMHITSLDVTVRTRKVYILHRTQRMTLRL